MRILVDSKFDDKYIPDPNSGCWIWIGATDRKGYGQIRKKNKLWQAHRYSYMIHNEDYDPILWVLHSCDIPCCVNPNHLRQGTIIDNMCDLVKRGRGRVPRHTLRGEGHPRRKLNNKSVVDIRKSYLLGTMSISELTIKYGVSRTTIRYIINRKTWTQI